MASATEKEQELRLPDEIWLEMFEQRLPIEDLLNARSVSRRWRTLATCRAAWRARCLSHLDPCVITALRIAPCVEVLDLRESLLFVEVIETPPAVLEAARVTACAAKQLGLSLRGSRTTRTLEVLSNQITLGRLRRLDLRIGHPCEPTIPAIQIEVLFGLLSESKIHDMGICNDMNEPLGAMARHPNNQLKHLRYRSDFHDPLLGSLLAAHALTLEHVQLLDSTSCSEAHVRQLNECAALRRLEVPLVPALARLDTLRLQDLVVDVQDASGSSRDVEALAASLAPAFRNACHLRRLVLYGWLYHPERGAVGMQLVEALASSGRASLRTLKLGVTAINCELPLRLLAPSLPGLRHLHTLRLPSLPPEELQEAVSPHSAPSLRLLDVTDWVCVDEAPCSLPAVRKLLSRNRSLHFRARSNGPHACRRHSVDVRCCYKTGHPVFDEDLAFAFYWHATTDRCGVLHSMTEGWIALVHWESV